MDQLDILYRAFLDYRKNTLEDAACQKVRRATARASADKDKVESSRSRCTIEEDWICAIEEGLPYVEKAIMEERQFIRQEGSIEPIEKVRHVSKDSVSHLARHGNLITRAPEDPEDDIIPEKLYIVEKLTNYAVYENRFLYMLLCYLRDFIGLRYNKIKELGHTYKGHMSLAKTVFVGKRTITYRADFDEKAESDPYTLLDAHTESLLSRMEVLQKNVSILLNTPLMREVSTAPLLKPPITRTNALRMDNALRQALALYDYVASYQKDGYTVEVIKKTYQPLPETMGDEFAELVVLTSFLVYEYGNGLKADLQKAYETEEARREAEAAEKAHQKLLDLRKRIKESGKSMEAYLLLLEERNQYLETLEGKLEATREQVSLLEKSLLAAEDEKKALLKRQAEQETQILALEEQMLQEEKEHEEKLLEVASAHERQISELTEAHESTLREARAQAEERLARVSEDYESKIASQTAALADVSTERARLQERNVNLTAQLHGLRQAHGLTSDAEDYTSEERYEELLLELRALDALIGKEWKKAKKRIRNDYLWRKSESKDPADTRSAEPLAEPPTVPAEDTDSSADNS